MYPSNFLCVPRAARQGIGRDRKRFFISLKTSPSPFSFYTFAYNALYRPAGNEPNAVRHAACSSSTRADRPRDSAQFPIGSVIVMFQKFQHAFQGLGMPLLAFPFTLLTKTCAPNRGKKLLGFRLCKHVHMGLTAILQFGRNLACPEMPTNRRTRHSGIA